MARSPCSSSAAVDREDVNLDLVVSRELSLAIDTPQGTVLIVGCSHPTLEKIVATASAVLGKPSIWSSVEPISTGREAGRG